MVYVLRRALLQLEGGTGQTLAVPAGLVLVVGVAPEIGHVDLSGVELLSEDGGYYFSEARLRTAHLLVRADARGGGLLRRGSFKRVIGHLLCSTRHAPIPSACGGFLFRRV
jgi:hypothetical protein